MLSSRLLVHTWRHSLGLKQIKASYSPISSHWGAIDDFCDVRLCVWDILMICLIINCWSFFIYCTVLRTEQSIVEQGRFLTNITQRYPSLKVKSIYSVHSSVAWTEQENKQTVDSLTRVCIQIIKQNVLLAPCVLKSLALPSRWQSKTHSSLTWIRLWLYPCAFLTLLLSATCQQASVLIELWYLTPLCFIHEGSDSGPTNTDKRREAFTWRRPKQWTESPMEYYPDGNRQVPCSRGWDDKPQR